MAITIKNSTIEFLKKLSKNNDREWFNKNKNLYLVAHENVVSFVEVLLSEMRKHDYNKRELLASFREQTAQAIRDKISLNPVLNSFQHVVHSYGIRRQWIDIFLDSMEMDLEQQEYNDENYNKYIFGSAEVVGLMCLHVFVEGDDELFEKLKPYAMITSSFG